MESIKVNKSASELAYNPEPKPEDKKEQWRVFNKMWEDQVKGSGIKVYEESAQAKLKACIVGDPYEVNIPYLSAEMYAMVKDNCPREMIDYWRDFGGKNMKDCDPERYDKIVNEIAQRDAAYEKAGVKIIRNLLGWYPDEVVNMPEAWDAGKWISIYAGAKWRTADKAILPAWGPGCVKVDEVASRAATIALLEEDPDSMVVPFLTHEPDPTVDGPGMAGLDLADWRLMPNKTLLFGFGVPSGDLMNNCSPSDTPAGIPRGRDLYMRVLSNLGFKCETWWFDSNLGYHEDCIMLNVKEGVIGLPDDGKNGMWSKLPDCLKDYEILPIPPDEILKGAANSTTMGDGRIFINSSCTKTIDMLDKRGYEPIPIDYYTCWDTFHSGIDCSDSNIWREND